MAGHTLASGGPAAAFIAFAMTAVEMATFMFGSAVLLDAAQERVVSALKAGTSSVKRWSGLILVALGLWLPALAVWADFFARFVPCAGAPFNRQLENDYLTAYAKPVIRTARPQPVPLRDRAVRAAGQ